MENISLKIRHIYDTLSNSHKLIANFLLENSNEFLNMTAIEIGERSNTSSASVVRFSKLLGFNGLDMLKRQLAIETQHSPTILDPIIQENDSVETISTKVEILINNSLNDLFYQIDIKQLKIAITLLKKANKTFIFGVGASSLSSYDLYHKLNRINRICYFNFDNHMTLEFINYAKDNDVVIAFSYSGNSIEAVTAAKIAKNRNIKVIGVTSNLKSPLAKLSDIILSVPKDEPLVRVGAITSKFNSLVIADLLYFGLISDNLSEVSDYFIETNQLTSKLKVD